MARRIFGRGYSEFVASVGVSTKGAARREAILEAAYNVLAQGGYAESSLRAIARAAGVEPTHVLYYFGSREQLLCEVIRRWDDKNMPEASRGEDGLDSLSTVISKNRTEPGIVHLYLTLAAEAVDPAHPAHEFFVQRIEATREFIAGAIRGRQAQGRVRADIDPDATARLLMSIADGMQLQSLINPSVDALTALVNAIAELTQTTRS